MTQQELADRIEVDKQTIWRYEAGGYSLFQKTIVDIANALGLTSPDQILVGAPADVQLVGEVGAGAEVFALDNANDWLAPPPGMDEPLALRVVGRSMMPVYRPGDILFAERRARMSADVIGLDCVVQVKEGPRLVKRVQAGAPGHFRLYSYDTQDESDDVVLEWAAPVRWVSR